jgi:hypothetical protein
MSLYLCSLTGEVPEKPIVNLKDGRIYEEKNIKKYLNFSTVDPFDQTKSILTKDLKEVPLNKFDPNEEQIFKEYINRLKSYDQVQNSKNMDIFSNTQHNLKSFNIGIDNK